MIRHPLAERSADSFAADVPDGREDRTHANIGRTRKTPYFLVTMKTRRSATGSSGHLVRNLLPLQVRGVPSSVNPNPRMVRFT